MGIRLSVVAGCCVLIFLSSFAGAQVAPSPLITKPIDETQLVTLHGSTHTLAQPQFDLGQAAPDMPLNRMLLVLKRSPQQDYALRKLLDDQQDKASPSYHKWLTPDQFGTAFGPSDQDVQTVTNWLQSHGLQVSRVSRGKTIIEFSGVESQVEAAFNTQIHSYMLPNGELHWANASDPQIPAALVPAVAGVRSLNNFHVRHYSQVAGVFSRNKSNGQLTPIAPQVTFPGGQCGYPPGCYGVGPYDFATIYDVANSWSASPAIDGTGETIAIVGETDINPQDVADFRAYFGLPAYGQPGGPALNIIHSGPAPGILSDGEETEADLDVEWSGAVAKGASVDFVVAQTTETTQGIDLSALYIVDNNLASVMSESYGACELHIGPAANQFYSTLWEQAAAQGITVMISAGDGSSAGCDDFNAGGPATLGLQVSGFASTPFNVAVGGTDFNDLTNASTYWSQSNTPTTQASALSYIPETTWNDTCTNPVFGNLLGFSKNAETNCNNSTLIQRGFVNIVGGSGGRSSCISSDGVNPASCSGGYPKPSWQNAPGVPSDGVRDVPDVSLFAASGSPSGAFYMVCEADIPGGFGPCNSSSSFSTLIGVGGTSASSPAFAGIMALVNQKMQARQGNANFVLYKLAQQQPSAFHDVTTGTIEVPCQNGSLNCLVNNAGDQYGILTGYNTAVGYDLATGIGSVDVGQLLQDWSLATFRPSLTTLGLSPTPTNVTHGQSVTVTASVAPSTGTGTPTGNVSLLTSTGVSAGGFTLANGQVSGSTNLLPGGTYTVTAHYAGDTTFGGSDSPAVSVTVAKESSSTQLQLETFDFQGHLISNNATTAVYGSPYILRMNVLNSQGAACNPSPLGQAGCPSGNLLVTDNGNPLDAGSFALNSLGYAEDQAIQLSGGSHPLTAQYAGDNSFKPSSATVTYSVTPAQSTIAAPALQDTSSTGSNAFITTTVQSSPTFGAAPTGTVTFFVNGTAVSGQSILNTGTLGNSGNNFTATSSAQVFTNTSPFPTPGRYTITASYGGDGNYQSSASPPAVVNIQFPQPNVNVQASAQSVPAGSPVTLTATVTGASKTVAPSGTISFQGYEGAVAGTVSYSTVTDPNTGFLDLQASLTIVPGANDSYSAQYGGDTNYPAQPFSGFAQVVVNGSDFSLSSGQTAITVPFAGASNSGTLLVGFQSSTAPVAFSASACTGLPSESVCTITPNVINSTQFANIIIGTTAPHALVLHSTNVSSVKHFWPGTLFPLSAIYLVGIPRRRFKRGLRLLFLAIFLLILPGCGGGGSNGGGGGGGNTDPGTPTGTYKITVTATSGTFSHSTSFQLIVQ